MAKSIAVAGKGGTGKTSLSASIISYLHSKGEKPILAIDADPDANLGILLGIELKQTVGDLREEVLKEIKNFPPGMSKAAYLEAGLHQIIEECESFDLITMGRSEGPGCYCYLNSLIRKFYDDLMPAYAWAVIDNEAGLEHISRRTTANIDALIVVVSDNPISIRTAKSIDDITKKIKTEVKNKFVVTNMLKPTHKDKTLEQIKELNMEHICDIPYDEKFEEAIYEHKLLNNISSLPIYEHIEKIINKIGGN